MLELIAPANALREFAGTPVFLSSVPEFEANRLLQNLAASLQLAGWVVTMQLPSGTISDGIEIEFVFEARRQPPDFKESPLNDRTKRPAEALLAESKKL